MQCLESLIHVFRSSCWGLLWTAFQRSACTSVLQGISKRASGNPDCSWQVDDRTLYFLPLQMTWLSKTFLQNEPLAVTLLLLGQCWCQDIRYTLCRISPRSDLEYMWNSIQLCNGPVTAHVSYAQLPQLDTGVGLEGNLMASSVVIPDRCYLCLCNDAMWNLWDTKKAMFRLTHCDKIAHGYKVHRWWWYVFDSGNSD